MALKSFRQITECGFGPLVMSFPTKQFTSEIGPRAQQFTWPSLKSWACDVFDVEKANGPAVYCARPFL